MAKLKARTLSLTVPQPASPVSSAITSPTDTNSQSPSPGSPPRVNAQYNGLELQPQGTTRESPDESETPSSPVLTSLPSIPSSPKEGSKHGREQSRSFFANLKASKSSNKVHKLEPTIRQVSEDSTRADPQTEEKTLYSLQKSPGSTPDLSLSMLNTSSLDEPNDPQIKTNNNNQRPVGPSVMSDSVLVTNASDPNNTKRGKPRFAHLLTRTRSIRTDEGGPRKSKPSTPILTTPIQTTLQEDIPQIDGPNSPGGLRTAPLQQEKDRSFRDMMGSAIRNKSADRQPSHKSSVTSNLRGRADRDQHSLATSSSTNFRENPGSHLFANIKNTSSKAADGLGKAGKGLFNKMGRGSTSQTRDEPYDGKYECKVINLPLIEQTRQTRIAKRLEDSKDKTEFWMPALPWRCIDYLNFRGCEEEGLYRVPGSGTKIKYYQERFDREYDINLFDEPELYDINIIGSLFKAWLRDLPSEILPKATQVKVAAEHPDAKKVPQLLRDELSMLPPWNYYLLFAITCHLSLLHAYVDKNKMNYSNLCICFQPCLGIDSYCFQFLVCDWRSCWQGCWTEKEYLEEEYRTMDGMNSSGNDSATVIPAEERSLPSAGSSKPTLFGRKAPPPPLSKTSEEHLSQMGLEENEDLSRSQSHLPELQPMVPLSPIGFEVSSRN